MLNAIVTDVQTETWSQAKARGGFDAGAVLYQLQDFYTLLYLVFAFVCTSAWSQTPATNHLRFAGLSLSSTVTDKLLRVGRAENVDEVARQLVKAFPELYLVIIDWSKDPLVPKLLWRDPRVEFEVARYYDVAGWLSTTLERYLPTEYVPFGLRPLMDRNVLLLRNYAPREILVFGALKHLISRALIEQFGWHTFVDNQERAFELIYDTERENIDPDEVISLALKALRATDLREVEAAEWMIRHRHDLDLSPRQTIAMSSQAVQHAGKAAQLLADLHSATGREPKIDPATAVALRAEIKALSEDVRQVLKFLRVVACEIDLNPNAPN